MKKVVVILLVAALVVGGWWYGSPLLTLKDMRDAALAGDAAALSGHVDYEAMRVDVRSEVREAATERLEGSGIPGGIAGLGGALAERRAGALVDQLVRPETVAAMFAADEMSEGQARAMVPDLSEEELVVTRHGFDRFTAGMPAQPIHAEFRRDGLGWKLAGIERVE
ncbi:DUF2939 domain-containing protein [Sphingomicrobium arenosum]|uniref:DUF2939 domain-containing protein n=1 Tax=Sphingomicrobium arenosum TaxID=2233861 RepID=UPI0022405569|nr:DUF2939 domain-containing protein [Sphingomicrobium arenosum]